MKRGDTLWVFQTFGFKAGIRFLWDSFTLRIKRFIKREKVIRFEDLSDTEAEATALAFGIYQWDDRAHLNRIWHNFNKTLN